MAKLNALSIVGIILVVIVVLIIIACLLRRFRESQKRANDSRRNESQSSTSSSSSGSDRSSGDRHRVQAPTGPSNYKVMNGKSVEPAQETVKVEAAQAQEQTPRVPVNAAFPRHVAKAGRPNPQDIEHAIAKTSGQNQQNLSSNHSQRAPDSVSVQNGKVETIYVESMAELYSPKENIEEEYGVDPDTLQKMVESYKKSKEYRERQIPVNRHFDLDKYKESKDVLRASAANMGVTYGSKRGQITGAIYKKYGKNFTTQRSQPTGDVPSLISSPALHAEQKRLSQERKNQGHLEVRN